MAREQANFHIVSETRKKVNKIKTTRPARGPPRIVLSKSGARRSTAKQRSQVRVGKHLSNGARRNNASEKRRRHTTSGSGNQPPSLVGEADSDEEEPDGAVDPSVSLLETDGQIVKHDGDDESRNEYSADKVDLSMSEVAPKVMTYQESKIFAQSNTEMALLAANVDQLHTLLGSSSTHPYYYFTMTLICFSIFLQVAVGIVIMVSNYFKINRKDAKCVNLNGIALLGMYLIIVLNVFITSFAMVTSTK